MTNSNKEEIKKFTYHISGEEDVINHFSLEGFELLSAPFLSFLDLMCPAESNPAPILLEITGAKLDEKQKKTIDNAIWLHFRLRMTRLARSQRACRMKILWFMLCTVFSSVFLYMVTKQTSEVATQFFYLPIWFFGYRLITYPLQEYLPLRRELKRCRCLAAMKLLFTEEAIDNISDELVEETKKDNAGYYDQAMHGIRNAELTKNFIKEDGTVILGCRVNSAEEMINPCSVLGNELISGELAATLDQEEAFVNPRKSVELNIYGVELSEQEKNTVQTAFANYEKLRYQKAVGELNSLYRKIISYAVGLLASTIVLYFCGSSAGLAMHEFLVIVLWFFGDYLVEFLLIGMSDAKYTVRLRRRLMKMKIDFC